MLASTRHRIRLASAAWVLALLTACGPAAPPPAPPQPSGPAKPAAAAASPAKAFDPCAESKPLEKAYTGLLREARCDQERFLIMAGIAQQLGVECEYCHVRSKEDPKKFDYPVMTPRKEIANWMGTELMGALRTADGSPLKCSQCHVDAAGKPKAKFLGTPRAPVAVQEWMTMVMVNRFRTADGDKLKCKSCHVDNFTKPAWQPKVILRSAQLPARKKAASEVAPPETPPNTSGSPAQAPPM